MGSTATGRGRGRKRCSNKQHWNSTPPIRKASRLGWSSCHCRTDPRQRMLKQKLALRLKGRSCCVTNVLLSDLIFIVSRQRIPGNLFPLTLEDRAPSFCSVCPDQMASCIVIEVN